MAVKRYGMGVMNVLCCGIYFYDKITLILLYNCFSLQLKAVLLTQLAFFFNIFKQKINQREINIQPQQMGKKMLNIRSLCLLGQKYRTVSSKKYP